MRWSGMRRHFLSLGGRCRTRGGGRRSLCARADWCRAFLSITPHGAACAIRLTSGTVSITARHAERPPLTGRLLLEPVEELLAELGDLRGDDRHAIRLVRVALEVIPVILLRRIELGERHDFRHHGIGPEL